MCLFVLWDESSFSFLFCFSRIFKFLITFLIKRLEVSLKSAEDSKGQTECRIISLLETIILYFNLNCDVESGKSRSRLRKQNTEETVIAHMLLFQFRYHNILFLLVLLQRSYSTDNMALIIFLCESEISDCELLYVMLSSLCLV